MGCSNHRLIVMKIIRSYEQNFQVFIDPHLDLSLCLFETKIIRKFFRDLISESYFSAFYTVKFIVLHFVLKFFKSESSEMK